MKKFRVYIDTSVIGGCLDSEFSEWSNSLFAEIQKGRKTAVISDLTLEELEKAPDKVKRILLSLKDIQMERVELSPEAENLAEIYLKEKIVGKIHYADAQHIAIATVEKVDVLVSWNFKQIVNLNKIHLFNAVNIKQGYAILEIRSPREVINEKNI